MSNLLLICSTVMALSHGQGLHFAVPDAQRPESIAYFPALKDSRGKYMLVSIGMPFSSVFSDVKTGLTVENAGHEFPVAYQSSRPPGVPADVVGFLGADAFRSIGGVLYGDDVSLFWSVGASMADKFVGQKAKTLPVGDWHGVPTVNLSLNGLKQTALLESRLVDNYQLADIPGQVASPGFNYMPNAKLGSSNISWIKATMLPGVKLDDNSEIVLNLSLRGLMINKWATYGASSVLKYTELNTRRRYERVLSEIVGTRLRIRQDEVLIGDSDVQEFRPYINWPIDSIDGKSMFSIATETFYPPVEDRDMKSLIGHLQPREFRQVKVGQPFVFVKVHPRNLGPFTLGKPKRHFRPFGGD